MEQQIMEPTNKSHRIVYAAIIIILTAGVVGGSLWYVMDKQAKEQQKQIEELQKKNEEKALIKAPELTKEDDSAIDKETKNETEGWKSYVDKVYDYSYKYPNWRLDLGKGDSNNQIIKDSENYITIEAISNTGKVDAETYFNANEKANKGVSENQKFLIGSNNGVVYDNTLASGRKDKVYVLATESFILKIYVVGTASTIETAEKILKTLVLK